jgi:hypothetical protein
VAGARKNADAVPEKRNSQSLVGLTLKPMDDVAKLLRRVDLDCPIKESRLSKTQRAADTVRVRMKTNPDTGNGI